MFFNLSCQAIFQSDTTRTAFHEQKRNVTTFCFRLRCKNNQIKRNQTISMLIILLIKKFRRFFVQKNEKIYFCKTSNTKIQIYLKLWKSENN